MRKGGALIAVDIQNSFNITVWSLILGRLRAIGISSDEFEAVAYVDDLVLIAKADSAVLWVNYSLELIGIWIGLTMAIKYLGVWIDDKLLVNVHGLNTVVMTVNGTYTDKRKVRNSLV